MNDLRDFLNWFDGFAENINKQPSPKQWTKIKERVAGLQSVGIPLSAIPFAADSNIIRPTSASKPPQAAYRFMIDENGVVMRTKDGKPVLPGDITSEIYDVRGQAGDLRSIIWADGSTGLNGADLTIVGA